jgi:hypothetical protein
METGGSQGITVNPRKRGRGVNIERDVVRMHNENQRCVGFARLVLFCSAVVCARMVVCLPLAPGSRLVYACKLHFVGCRPSILWYPGGFLSLLQLSVLLVGHLCHV